MAGRRVAPRKDINHPEIIQHFEAIGARTVDTAQHGMSVDIFAWFRGSWFMFEVKRPEKIRGGRAKSLTEKEKELAQKIYPAPYYVISSKAEGQAIIMGDEKAREECNINSRKM